MTAFKIFKLYQGEEKIGKLKQSKLKLADLKDEII